MQISFARIGPFLASGIVAQIAAAIAGLMLVRWMSVSDYAIYTIGVSMAGAITLLTRGGVRLGLAAVLADVWPDRGMAAEALSAARSARLLISGVTLPLILGIGWFLLDRAGASTAMQLVIIGILAAIWIADYFGGVIDQVLYFDDKAVRVQGLDTAIAWGRLGLIGLLRLGGAVSVISALLTSLFVSVARIPIIRSWVGETVGHSPEPARPEVVRRVREVALRQVPVDLFVAMQTQAALYYLTQNGGGIELATYGALARIAQILTPFAAVSLAFFVPAFAPVRERVGLLLLGYVGVGALPGLALLAWAIAAPATLLFFIGPAYAEQTWPLQVCAALVAVTSAVEVAASLVAHRGWNRWGWIRIAFGLVWIAVAPMLFPIDTAAGGYLFFCGFSVGTVIALTLDLLAAQKRGEIRLGRPAHKVV